MIAASVLPIVPDGSAEPRAPRSQTRAKRKERGRRPSELALRGVLGTPFGDTKHRGHGREHAIQTLQSSATPR